MLSTHGKSSHPLSYRAYKDLPKFLKPTQVTENDCRKLKLTALVGILLTLEAIWVALTHMFIM